MGSRADRHRGHKATSIPQQAEQLSLENDQTQIVHSLYIAELKRVTDEFMKIPATVQALTAEKSADRPRRSHSRKDTEHDRVKSPNNLEALQQLLAAEKQKTVNLESQLRKAQTEVSSLRKKEASLRDVILRNVGGAVTTDQEVVHAFSNLRQRTQGLAKHRSFDMDQATLTWVPCRSMATSVKDFYERWHHIPKKLRVLYLWAEIFSMLHLYALSEPIFGIAEWTPRGSTAFDPPRVEQRLAQFEDQMKLEGVPSSDIANWRLATLKCTEFLRDGNDTGDQMARYLEWFVGPLIAKAASQSQLDSLHADIRRLTVDSYKLGLLMRKAELEYSCIVPSGGAAISQCDDEADVFDTLNDGPEKQEPTVAFTLFGALIRPENLAGGSRVVLEKAQVVVKLDEGK